MRLKGKAVVGVALVLAGLGVWGTQSGWWGQEDKLAVNVVIAKKYLPAGTILEASMLDMATIPKAYIQPGALRQKIDAVGQATVAQMAGGEQVLANKISESPPSVSSAVPFGHRAFVLPPEAGTGMAGLIKAGDLVDILATVEGAEGQKDVMQTTTLVQQVKVIAVGSRFRPTPVTKKSAPAEEYARATGGEAVTVAVTSHEAELLAFAEQRGRLKMVVRSVGDTETVMTRPVNFGSLLKGGAPSKPSTSPSTQIIQGLDPPER